MDPPHSEIELRLKETVICSEVNNSSGKQEWCKITRNVDLVSSMMQNKRNTWSDGPGAVGSTTFSGKGQISSILNPIDLAYCGRYCGTLKFERSLKLNNSLQQLSVTHVVSVVGAFPMPLSLVRKKFLLMRRFVQDEHAAVIKCGSEISPSPSDEGFVKYRFEMMPTEESRRYIQVSLDVEYEKCCICLNIWHDVVTAAPCLHNFCNGCFSEWLRRSQERRSSVLCPQCRAFDILLADPSLKRSSEDTKLLDSCASIKSPLVSSLSYHMRFFRELQVQRKALYSRFSGVPLQFHVVLNSRKSRWKREHSPSDAADSWEHSCPQCGLGCDRAFCAAYWHSQGVSGSNSHPLCSREMFKPIAERTNTRIPSLAHEKNHFEQNITERCIRQMGRSLQDVVADWILKLDKREIDRTRMPLNHAEMITSRTYTCRVAMTGPGKLKGKTAGMDMLVAHSTITKNMLGREIMSAGQRGFSICRNSSYSFLFEISASADSLVM
ncbi:hypothetical protein RND71_040295 [Anisodus tanguticus]|uniref:RING-type domain-containing protein n=1 Tax=Anisodus tanguticus TaxID=243964 RepID=A0AAE1QSK4_9SOLA|nr:hypothetical protein RND71_040295 [Anisodus tanguticus]